MPQDDLNSWLKASAENKITTKNTWKSTLIEHFVNTEEFRAQNGVNFQKASCTLEGCMKVYSTRVDDVSENTLKLLEIFNKDDETKKKTTSKKRSNFIEKNLNNINLKNKEDLDYYDPVFSSILHMKDGCFLLDILESTDNGILLFSDTQKTIVMDDQKIDIDAIQLPICNSLKDFEAVKSISEYSRIDEPQFDINDFTMDEPNFLASDEAENEPHEIIQNEINIFHETPFGYFKGWAGPSHWKIHTNTGARNAKEKRQRQRFFLDFKSPVDHTVLESTAITIMNKEMILERRKNKNFLPDDYSYDVSDLYKYIKINGYFATQVMNSIKNTQFSPGNDGPNLNEESHLDESPHFNEPDFGIDDDLGVGVGQSLILNDKLTDIESSQINLKFTKVPKKVDIKKLKENVITLINNKCNRLSQIVDQIPGNYSEKEGKDISPHFCLISLLYLANEKGIELKSTGDDLFIDPTVL